MDDKKKDADGKAKSGADKAKKPEVKAKNGKVEKDDEDEDEDAEDDEEDENDGLDKNNEVAEDDENVVALAEIDRINENINKTRVDGLQALHAVSLRNTSDSLQSINDSFLLDLFWRAG